MYVVECPSVVDSLALTNLFTVCAPPNIIITGMCWYGKCPDGSTTMLDFIDWLQSVVYLLSI